MPIDFDAARWKKIITDSEKWWAGDLERPLIQVRLEGIDPGRSEPELGPYSFVNGYFSDFVPQFSLDVSPELIVDRWDHALCSCEYLGDGYPNVCPNFGPGIIAAFMGATLESKSNTTWMHYEGKEPIDKLQFKLDTNNVWFKRAQEIIKTAIQRWQGTVQISYPDLGGNMDILTVFRDTRQLVFDIADNPEQVDRLLDQVHEIWWQFYEIFDNMLIGNNPGRSSWGMMLSQERHYMLQCDFCYLTGPDIFERFAKPELVKTAKGLPKAFYHLDGPGQLVNLDSLLETDEICGIQWVPGAGAKDVSQWPEVYQKIQQAGKVFQIWDFQYESGPFDELPDILCDQLGSLKGLCYMVTQDIKERDRVQKLLEKYC